jgi:hypothetical protein
MSLLYNNFYTHFIQHFVIRNTWYYTDKDSLLEQNNFAQK